MCHRRSKTNFTKNPQSTKATFSKPKLYNPQSMKKITNPLLFQITNRTKNSSHCNGNKTRTSQQTDPISKPQVCHQKTGRSDERKHETQI